MKYFVDMRGFFRFSTETQSLEGNVEFSELDVYEQFIELIKQILYQDLSCPLVTFQFYHQRDEEYFQEMDKEDFPLSTEHTFSFIENSFPLQKVFKEKLRAIVHAHCEKRIKYEKIEGVLHALFQKKEPQLFQKLNDQRRFQDVFLKRDIAQFTYKNPVLQK